MKILIGLLLAFLLGWLGFVYIIDRPRIWVATDYKIVSSDYIEGYEARELRYNAALRMSTYRNVYHPAHWQVCGCFWVEGGPHCECYYSSVNVDKLTVAARYTFTPYRNKLICEVIK